MNDFEMDERFAKLAVLIGEKARAKMLWHLLDGRAYTALELAGFANISKHSCSNHLKKLVNENILKVEKQGRHRYFRLFDKQVARALEGIAFLTSQQPKNKVAIVDHLDKTGIRYARSCYDHLAGNLGVALQESLVNQGFLELSEGKYNCSELGKEKFRTLGIFIEDLRGLKRKFAYPCLDWSERKYHIGGALGASLLHHMIKADWLRKKMHSRELILTSKGRHELEKNFKFELVTS